MWNVIKKPAKVRVSDCLSFCSVYANSSYRSLSYPLISCQWPAFLSAYALLVSACYKKGYADLISSKVNDFLVSVITSMVDQKWRNKDGDRWIILLIKAVQSHIFNNGKLWIGKLNISWFVQCAYVWLLRIIDNHSQLLLLELSTPPTGLLWKQLSEVARPFYFRSHNQRSLFYNKIISHHPVL